MTEESIRALQSNFETLKGRVATLEANLRFLAEMSLTADDYIGFLKICEAFSNIQARAGDEVRQMLPDPPSGGDGAPEH